MAFPQVSVLQCFREMPLVLKMFSDVPKKLCSCPKITARIKYVSLVLLYKKVFHVPEWNVKFFSTECYFFVDKQPVMQYNYTYV